MTTEDFSRITTQIESYCNTEMFDDTANAYRRMFINRNYDQVREAVDLAYMGGYLNENAQKRTIPAPHIFDQFFRNIERREEKAPTLPETAPEVAKFNRGMVILIIGLMQIRFKPDCPESINWRGIRINGKSAAQHCLDFWNNFNCGAMTDDLFLQTIVGIAPGLEKEIEIAINKPKLQSDVPF